MPPVPVVPAPVIPAPVIPPPIGEDCEDEIVVEEDCDEVPPIVPAPVVPIVPPPPIVPAPIGGPDCPETGGIAPVVPIGSSYSEKSSEPQAAKLSPQAEPAKLAPQAEGIKLDSSSLHVMAGSLTTLMVVWSSLMML
jgi:hypothetical protein